MKHSWMIILALLFASNLAVARQDSMTNSGSWSGVIINSGCTADEAFAEAAKCTEKVPGAKLVLYDDTTRQIYDLDPANASRGHLGDSVTVRGRSTAAPSTSRRSSYSLRLGSPSDRRRPPFPRATSLARNRRWKV